MTVVGHIGWVLSDRWQYARMRPTFELRSYLFQRVAFSARPFLALLALSLFLLFVSCHLYYLSVVSAWAAFRLPFYCFNFWCRCPRIYCSLLPEGYSYLLYYNIKSFIFSDGFLLVLQFWKVTEYYPLKSLVCIKNCSNNIYLYLFCLRFISLMYSKLSRLQTVVGEFCIAFSVVFIVHVHRSSFSLSFPWYFPEFSTKGDFWYGRCKQQLMILEKWRTPLYNI